MMTGECLCGAVRIRVADGHEAGASACHCGLCRRWTGAAFWGFSASPDLVEVTGRVSEYRSTPFSHRGFCGTCGTHLWIRDDDGDYDLMPGLFADAAKMPLDHEVYADRALACVPLAGDHPRITAAEYEARNPFVEGWS